MYITRMLRRCRTHEDEIPDMSHIDNKQELSHIEDGGKYEEGVKVDDVAADYIDASVQISPEENIRLRRKIYKQCVASPPAHNV